MVVAGGDGTVNYVVNAANARVGYSVGVVPRARPTISPGAGRNRASRSRRRPDRFGKRRPRSMWCVNGLWFVNIFSFGIFTTTSQRTPDERKHKIGKLAYIIEG